MNDAERIARLLERPAPAIVAELHAALAARHGSDQELCGLYLAERQLDHDLRRLLSEPGSDASFLNGVLAAQGQERQDSGQFISQVVDRTSRAPAISRSRRQRAQARPWWQRLTPLLACAALLMLAAGGIWLAGQRPAETGTLPLVAPAVAPAPVAPTVLATVTVEAGRLLRTGTSGDPQLVSGSRDLVAGDRVELTPGAGYARLLWRDGTTSELQPGTALTLSGPREVHLDQGRLHAHVAPVSDGDPWRFATPHGRMQVLGTRFTLACLDGSTTLAVEEGSVKASNHLGSQVVAAGLAVQIAAGQAPEKPLPVAAGGLWLGQLGQTWRPLFDGRTVSLLNQASAVGWQVADGALVPIEPLDRREAAQTVAGFTEVEIRFSFTVIGDGYAFFVGGQSAGGGARVAFPDILKHPGLGDHELVLRLHGDQASARLDGRPCPVEGQRSSGCIQFNVWNRCLRLTGLEVRDP